ncbi:MAG TPA: universal stress protein [Gaiellaceae bacterium]|nr:universal stress protein [Gaiellaceae bacterium]
MDGSDGARTPRLTRGGILPVMVVQPRRILVAFDGSEQAWRALDVAARMTGYGSTLTVVSVGRDGNGSVRGLLDEAHARLLGHRVPATYVERHGAPAAELVAAAGELGSDLVVIGRRAGGGTDEPLPGSVSAEVLREAPCDVLVIR